MNRVSLGRLVRGVGSAVLLAGAGAAFVPALGATSGQDAHPRDAQRMDECGTLATLSLPDVVVTSATAMPASDSVPAYCKVMATLETTIGFEVALPSRGWNGKYWVAGGGGYNGSIPDLKQALQRGYAAAGSDTGHQGTDASFAWNNAKAQIDYGYRATHLVTELGKQFVKAYYGQAPHRSYFVGCSNGGKMGLMEIQRYPEDFDGVIVGCPVIDRTNLMVMGIWNGQAFAADPIPKSKLVGVVAKASLAACDAQDGLADGLIDIPDHCKFDPKVMLCKGPDSPDCLTAGQVTALQKVYSGPVNSNGEQLFPGFPPGHEEDFSTAALAAGSEHTWAGTADSFMRYFVFGPNYDSLKQFNFDTSLAALKPFAEAQDATKVDLSEFKAHGGKLIMYVGWADHNIPAPRAIKYYQDVRQTTSGADQFITLFMVPGMHHCTKGPGPWNFGGRGQRWLKDDPEHDIVRALDRWVEEGIAPKSVVAAKFVNDDPEQGLARTRPLCPYPEVAKYKGSGSIDEAANFACATPKSEARTATLSQDSRDGAVPLTQVFRRPKRSGMESPPQSQSPTWSMRPSWLGK